MVLNLRNPAVAAWLIPLSYAAGARLVGFTVPRLAYSILPGYVSTVSVNAAIGIYSAVASGMIALTGIVFSLTFVMVQFSATAYSPRLVLWVARDPMISHAMGVFTATFLYAVAALAWVDRGGSGRVPLAGAVFVVALLIVSVVMFIFLIHRVGMLQVNRMLIFTADQGRNIIENLYPPCDTPPCQGSAWAARPPCVQTVLHRGQPLIIQKVNIPALVEIARRNGKVVELVASVGDAALEATPLQAAIVLPLRNAVGSSSSMPPTFLFILVGPIKGLTAHPLNRRRVVGNHDGPFVLPSCSGCGPGFPGSPGAAPTG
jgi:uncharacterized membrane protein